jgi:hypothetical protein
MNIEKIIRFDDLINGNKINKQTAEECHSENVFTGEKLDQWVTECGHIKTLAKVIRHSTDYVKGDKE